MVPHAEGPETGPPQPSEPLTLDDVARAWWIPLLAGLLNLVAGLIVLIEPHNSLLAIALVIGIYLVLVGVMVLAAGFRRTDHRGAVIALGLLAIIAGAFVIARPGSAVHGVRIVFGIYLIISGVAHLAMGGLISADRGRELLVGVLELVAGIVFLAAPKLGLAALALFVGIYLLLRAAMEIALALALRQVR